jgi:uncharacterized cupredoxin-like copper-binding protein
VALCARSAAYNLLDHSRTPDEAVCFSDNDVDLAPGEEREIVVTNQNQNQCAALTPEVITVGWR